ncbi:extracellular solute-binding protein [Kineosporia rhizophila]|uniref:extracellular solute-binding protein n=1 Tax=Kineosporia TaxID=49184 RepID=UPI001E53B011|nr:extracellular solute-binding protein [Kineosporia sp. NBRC 101677]MCE0539782.1 extracellular solute-binding protein [Kineosporia rhizophila]GLY13368.1 ABC transporter substrate-binding protein [Kineosporia sp. NBRC 101677]
MSAGAVGGGLVEWALHDLNPTRWIADRLASNDGTVLVHGGDDSNEARDNTLAVWSATPRAGRVGRVAHYFPVGSSSDDQAGIVRNKLSAAEPETDLVVIDPEHLPGLVEDRLVQALPDAPALTDMLRDEGCFAPLVARCRVGQGSRAPLYALPLNADAPLLVIDLTLFPPKERRSVVDRLVRLEQTAQAAEFWLTAQRFADASVGPMETRRILLQAGPYEGLTVSLVELIHAFGGDVRADPTLATPAGRAALNQLKQRFPTEQMFALPTGNDEGDENGTLVAVQEHRAAFARLWPSQYRQLLTETVAEESGGRAYAAVRIPGGVLGGQVVALAHNATAPRAALEVATFLARGQGQSQLFHVGGYVPTLGPVFFENTVKAQLEGMPAALGTAVSRPSIRRYAPWSSAFREQVRLFLLGRPIDVETAITGNLKTFVTD